MITPSSPLEFPRINRWIQRLTVATLLALALVLVGLGIALYAPSANANDTKSLTPEGPRSAGLR
jgi:hypothetical protein